MSESPAVRQGIQLRVRVLNLIVEDVGGTAHAVTGHASIPAHGCDSNPCDSLSRKRQAEAGDAAHAGFATALVDNLPWAAVSAPHVDKPACGALAARRNSSAVRRGKSILL